MGGITDIMSLSNPYYSQLEQKNEIKSLINKNYDKDHVYAVTFNDT